VKARELFGLQIDQGLGIFSLKQSGKAVATSNLNSANWVSNIKIRRKFTPNSFWEVSGAAFLLPLSVQGAKTGPRLLKLEGGLGGAYRVLPRMLLLPSLGFRYQTLSTSEVVGYRNITGGQISLAQAYLFESQQTLHTAVYLAVFGNENYQFSSKNRELGARMSLEWPLDSPLITSLYLGGEWQTQSLLLNGVNLTSSYYSGFIGVLF